MKYEGTETVKISQPKLHYLIVASSHQVAASRNECIATLYPIKFLKYFLASVNLFNDFLRQVIKFLEQDFKIRLTFGRSFIK